jgi:fatty-acyl-CoA synthase
VGELCRYLLATPKSEYDRKHEVRIASGNGMRAEVWDKFKERFGIPTIEEYYRATEVHIPQRTKLIVGSGLA